MLVGVRFLRFILATGLIWGCARKPVEAPPTEQASDEEALPVTLQVELGAAPSDGLTFADVVIGTSRSHDVVITNTGDVAVAAASLTLSSSVFSYSGACAALDPGQSCTLSVSFQPLIEGPVLAEISMSYDGGGTLVVSLAGSGVTPASLAASPANHAFGFLPAGTSATQAFVLSNTGGGPAIDLSALPLSAPFSFAGGAFPGSGGTCTSNLPGDSTCTIRVTFEPVAGCFNDKATFTFGTGLTNASLDIALSASGDDSEVRRDTCFADLGNVRDLPAAMGRLGDATSLLAQGEKLVAAAVLYDGFNYRAILTRLLADGSVDSSFGDGGYRALPFELMDYDSLVHVAAQTSGKLIVVAQIRRSYNSAGLGLTRLSADGTIDNSFGTDGFVFDFISHDDPRSIAIQDDDKIVVAGRTYIVSEWDVFVARYNVDGTPDTASDGDSIALDTDGKRSWSITGSDEPGQVATGVVAGERKTYLAVGSNFSIGQVIRLNEDGSHDLGYDSDGTSPAFTNGASKSALTVLSDGSAILCGGQSLAKLTPQGALDTAFASDGEATLPERINCTGVAQIGQKIYLAGHPVSSPNMVKAVAYNTDGSRDNGLAGDATPSDHFGTGGVTTIDVDNDGGTHEFTSRMIAVARSGEDGFALVVSGSLHHLASVRTWGVFLVSLRPSGELDAGFAEAGVRYQKELPDYASFRVEEIALTPDGHMAVVGSAGHINAAGYSVSEIFVARYLPDGSRNTGFGSGGVAMSEGAGDEGHALAALGDGRVVAAGCAGNYVRLVAFTAAGTLDTDFADAGIAEAPSYGCGKAVAVQSDGKILVAGPKSIGFNGWFVARYHDDGTLDLPDDRDPVGLGSTGDVELFATDYQAKEATALLVQPDQKIVVAGWSDFDRAGSVDSDIVVTRLNPDGTPDLAFGSNGTVTINLGGDELAFSVARQSDGKFVLAGAKDDDTLLIRLNSDGSLDDGGGSDATPGDAFGDAGLRLSTLGPARSVAVFADGAIVAVVDTGLAGFTPAGAIDTAFGPGGVRTLSTGAWRSVAIDAEQRALVAGYGPPTPEMIQITRLWR